MIFAKYLVSRKVKRTWKWRTKNDTNSQVRVSKSYATTKSILV